MDPLQQMEEGHGSTSSTDPEDRLWTDDQEAVLKKWGEEGKGLLWMHSKCETWFNRIDKLISLPAGILSVLLGVAIFATYDNLLGVKITFGAISFIAGAFSFTRDYLQYSKRSARHCEAKNQYQLLSDMIETELTLDRSTRQSSKKFFKLVKDRRNQLISANYPSIINRYINAYNKKYHRSGIFKPIITGNLTEIAINRENYPRPPETPERIDQIAVSRIIENETRNPAVQFELQRYREQS